jgi:cathepsin X
MAKRAPRNSLLLLLVYIHIYVCLLSAAVCMGRPLLREGGCVKHALKGQQESLVLTPPPETWVNPADIPKNWDWRNREGVVYTTKIGNQFSPKFCGSCWAWASTSALADRIKIKTKSQYPDINFSVQALLDCGSVHGAGSCDGGSTDLAYKFIHDVGITDDTCLPYMAVDYYSRAEQPCEQTMCRTCDRFGYCHPVANATKYYVAEHGSLFGEAAMLAEIWKRGPITCYIYAHSASFENYRSGIINDTTVYPEITHAISVVGWGETNDGVKYWIGRNSFGTQWGEQGWFKIVRGKNCLLIESGGCSWAVPA